MAAVTDALSELPGVANVKIDFPNRVAHVELDSDDFDTDAALQKLEAAKYPATLVN